MKNFVIDFLLSLLLLLVKLERTWHQGINCHASTAATLLSQVQK